MAVTAAQSVAPDAVEHLLNAARAVVDARADDLQSQHGKTRNLERIDIA
jgi:hypothetical protein